MKQIESICGAIEFTAELSLHVGRRLDFADPDLDLCDVSQLVAMYAVTGETARLHAIKEGYLYDFSHVRDIVVDKIVSLVAERVSLRSMSSEHQVHLSEKAYYYWIELLRD